GKVRVLVSVVGWMVVGRMLEARGVALSSCELVPSCFLHSMFQSEGAVRNGWRSCNYRELQLAGTGIPEPQNQPGVTGVWQVTNQSMLGSFLVFWRVTFVGEESASLKSGVRKRMRMKTLTLAHQAGAAVLLVTLTRATPSTKILGIQLA